MQKVADRLLFSPSDLNHFLECEHLIQLDRGREHDATPRERDPHADLLAAKGLEHERAWLERFRVEGRDLVVIDAADRDWDRAAAQTVAAMRDGAGVIYQGVFVHGDWHGISDFLVRVEQPSIFGSWSYEAWDTKLARHSKPHFILQLCFYTEQISRLQGHEPEWMHVVLGTGEHERFRYSDVSAYYRVVRRRFLSAAASSRLTYPYPVAHCDLCDYALRCREQWNRDDHLSLVANIRRDQVQKLSEIGIRTVAELATLDAGISVGIGAGTLARLRHQAALQSEQRRTGRHRFELLPPGPDNGFRLLPRPSEGDVFFDMEGYPYFEPAAGLEYLFGVMTLERKYHAFHASNREEEKRAFEQFIDFLTDRFARWPDLHVYHYAAYEPSTLKRLMSAHGTREAEVDDLLRRDVFVDLYQIVRQSIRISHPSYSIKRVRTFFMDDAGQGAVSDGGDSVLAFEQWLRTRDSGILTAIERYNEEDCLSTVKLRDWLIERRAELERAMDLEIPWPDPAQPELSEKRIEEDAVTQARIDRLLASGEPASVLLAHLLGYHRREAEPEWWAYFDRQDKSVEELFEDVESLAYVEANGGPLRDDRLRSRSWVQTATFPTQETKIRPESRVRDPFNDRPAGEVIAINVSEGWLKLLRGPSLLGKDVPRALVPDKPIDASTQRKALARVADDVLSGSSRFSAARDILEVAAPRLSTVPAGSPIQTLDLEEQKRLVALLDSSHLFIQGPPGSGKTYTGARLIVALLHAGKRVGVTATSHKAIHNLLDEVESVAADEHVAFRGLKKRTSSEESAYGGRSFENTDDNESCEQSHAQLIAGTSWLFAREGMEQSVDFLFIDEAGQLSLADAVAVATAARNIVLLGDPQQLPHVTQGVHPEGSRKSVLEHLLGDRATVAPDRGLFLAHSWRMHPEICRFVSEHSYDGRLDSAAGCERQRIDSPGLAGAGLRYMAVEHQGNQQQSREEADVIAAEIRTLLAGGTFTNREGVTRALAPADILVVAPYNMQVRCLRERLPASVEVGTVDKFQGREAPIVYFSMASSSGEDVPRGLEFLFNRNRFNVAVSRAKCLAVVVCSPRLIEARCRTVEQMRLVNALSRFVARAAGPTTD
jgi:predicted RecB family nuclease